MKCSTPCIRSASITYDRNGFPATGAMHLGKSGTASRNLVPRPPAKTIASNIFWLAIISVQLNFRKVIFFYQLADNMAQHNMAFLDAWGVCRWDIQQII